MKFNYKEIKEWPPLSWMVILKNSADIVVLHGSRVEINHEFFCEAVWDGQFIKGDFDQTDIVFGSGARLRENEIYFVISCATLDRLHHYFDSNNGILISNSLTCLLSFINEKLDPTYKKYYSDFLSITNGINKYKNFIDTLNNKKIYFTYYHNLKWDGKNLTSCKKNTKVKDFNSYKKFYNFLSESIQNLFSNATDNNRQFILKKLGTLSKGYDSPTVTALAKSYGLNKVIAFDKDRRGNRDCGDDIASVMDVEVIRVSREAWKSSEFSEIPFIAGDSRGEDVIFAGIPDNIIKNSIFLTGYYGDKVWHKYPLKQKFSDELTRHDTAGLSLTEYRLWKGFIHVPIPFIVARQIHDINKISNSEEMRNWNVPSPYNRPICRRILEELGVPRNAFGQEKHVATVQLSHRWTFITENSQKAFYSWLKCQNKIFKQKGKLFPNKRMRLFINTHRRVLLKTIKFSLMLANKFKVDTKKITHGKFYNNLQYDYWFDYVYPWAIEKAKEQYKAVINL